MSMSVADFNYEIAVNGYVVFPEVVPVPLLERMRHDIPKHQAACREAQLKNGLAANMEGAAHHVLGRGDSLDEFLENLFLDEYLRAYFGGEYILNSIGALVNMPFSKDAYKHGHNFHRDVRTYSDGFRLMMNMLVMIDDFTVENGATRIVPGTHRVRERPTDEYFEKHAIQATGKAGGIVLFDSNLWHSAAPNSTTKPRMAVTPTFSRPFFKQQMDYPRMLGESFPKNERMRQVLGYNARVPGNLDEWYQPPERRMYKPGQG